MQPDHDLVLLTDSGEVIWRTKTVGKGMGGETVYAAVDDEGVLHGMYDREEKEVSLSLSPSRTRARAFFLSFPLVLRSLRTRGGEREKESKN